MRKTSLHLLDPSVRVDPGSFKRCLAYLDRAPEYRPPQGSVSVACVDPVESGRLHERFFGDPEPTDVMTFPGDEEDGHAGDIAICPAVALEAAARYGSRFSEELTLYLVHGWLHLSGLDDRTEGERQAMRNAESVLMEGLRIAGALLVAEPRSERSARS